MFTLLCLSEHRGSCNDTGDSVALTADIDDIYSNIYHAQFQCQICPDLVMKQLLVMICQ